MAKKIVDEDMVLNIIINGDKGKSELLKLERSIKDLNIANEGLTNKMTGVKQKMDDLKLSGKGNSDEFNNLRVELNQLQGEFDKNSRAIETARSRMDNIRKGMDITKMSVTDLRREITRLTKLRNTADPGSKQWREFDVQLVKVQKRLAEVSQQGIATKGILCRMADGINKYWNFVVSGLASLTGVVLGVKSAINKYVEFTDVLADVRKTTGLTEEGVLQLNDALLKIDTRSSQEELMGLARIGGKLGIEGKENLEGFVRAADKINVALKEDLGGDVEESIRQVGKLVDIFKLKEDFGIEQALLKVGSVINELGAASTANEGYLVEFTKRVAGVAPSVGMSVDQVMGLAATLDQLGQTAEVSSTVYSKLVSGMFKSTAQYANVAGMSLADFSKLMKEDANEALIRLFDGLKGNNSEMEKLVANMGDIGMDNVRAVSVLGALANNTQMLREQQALANMAFVEGISLTEEFKIKNNNLAALREKAKKDLNERIKLLGEKLQPLLLLCTSSMSLMVKVLSALIDFSGKYGGKLLWLASAIGVYTVALKGVIIWRRVEEALVLRAISLGLQEANGVKALAAAKIIFTGSVKKAIVAVKALWTAMLANPWTLLATAIAGVVSYLVFFVDWTNKAKKAILDCRKEIAMEQAEANRLFEAYKKTNAGTRERIEIIKILQEKYGSYLQNLIDEKGNLKDVAEAQRIVNDEISRNVALRMKEQASADITSKYMETYVEALDSLREKLTKKVGKEAASYLTKEVKTAVENGLDNDNGLVELFHRFNLYWIDFHNEIVDVKNPFQQMQEKLAELDDRFEVFLGKIRDEDIIVGPISSLQNKGVAGKEKTKYDKDEVVVPAPALKVDYNTEIIALKEKYAKKLITQEEYENKLDSLELAHLEYRLKNEKLEDQKRVELQQKIADKKVEITEKAKKKEQQIDSIIDSKTSPVLQENKAYDDRLKKAGLFGKDREKLTDKELKALEILEKEHQDNLEKMDRDSRRKRSEEYMKDVNVKLKNLEIAHSIEKSQLEVQRNEELASFSGSLFQKRELQKKHQSQMMNLTEKQANEMMDLVANIFVDLKQNENDLGEQVLTDEQKLELQNRIESLKQALAELGVSKNNLTNPEQTDFDLLGMSSGKWEEFFSNLEKGKAGINDLEFAVNALSNGWNAYNKLREAQGRKELKQYEDKAKKEKAVLDSQLESGKISQEQYNAKVSQLDADLDAKKEELEREQSERERKQALFSTILSTAIGIAKAWELGPIIGPIMSALVAAMGAVQIATIQAAQYARGKYPVIGSDDGKLYQADYAGGNLRTGVYENTTLGLFSEKQPEMVVDGATTRKLIFDYPQIYQSIIDISRGQVPQFADGKYPPENASLSSDPVIVNNADPDVKVLLRKNIEMMNVLMGMELHVSMYGKNGFMPNLKKAQEFEQNIKV